jgi:esterase/lipase
MFNGTNAVKEELHWWGNALLERGMAVIAFDGPGMGHTFHRLSMVAEPRPVGEAIMNEIEAHPELDINSVGMFGLSLGGYICARMAVHDPRIRAVAAVSPPYALDVYWNITLAGMRRELAALYGIEEREMGAQIERITLAGVIDELRCPLMLAAGGHDHLTPGREAWHIYNDARCEREMVYYPRAGHECFNVLADLRPRMTNWLARQIGRHRGSAWAPAGVLAANELYEENGDHDPARSAAEAVDADFADALNGEVRRPVWNRLESPGVPVRWRWPWVVRAREPIEVVVRTDPGEFGPGPGPEPSPRLSGDALAF